MANLRGKPFAVIPARDDEKPSKAIEQVQRNVFDTFDQLEDARRGLLISTVANVPASIVLSEQLVVVYTGKGGDVMRLPPASLRGSGRGQVLLVANQGTGTVTLAPSGRDTLNGVATVAANGTAAFWSDGSTKWHELSVPANVVLSTRNLVSTADITLDGSASATKDLSADRTIGLANAGAGAGTIGTAGITSITLDAKGRVTAAAIATYVIAARSLISTADILLDGAASNTVDLSANRTIGLANAGAGAATYGSGASFVQTVTVDAKGRVTSATAASATTGDWTARDHIGRRLVVNTGTAIVAGDFTLSAGFGATRSISAVTTGTRDMRGQFQVTAAGAGLAANPTITLTFKDGAFPAAPFAMVLRNGGSQPLVQTTWSTTATTLVITFVGTPVAAEVYGYNYMVMG